MVCSIQSQSKVPFSESIKVINRIARIGASSSASIVASSIHSRENCVEWVQNRNAPSNLSGGARGKGRNNPFSGIVHCSSFLSESKEL